MMNHASAQFGLSSILNPEGSRLFPQTLTIPRHPGKPDLRWRAFDWEYTDRIVKGVSYRLYFYKEEEWIAQLAIPFIEEQILRLIHTFNYRPSKRFAYLLLGSRREFEQINIFNVSEGVQGITSTTEQTMAIPYWGEIETFRHISTHEMVHQFQVQKVTQAADPNSTVALNALPLWFVEGMAEYYSLNGVDAETRQYMRDAMLYPKPEQEFQITQFFQTGTYDFVHIYKMGQAKIDFLERQFGVGTAQRILEATTRIKDQETTFEKIVTTEVKSTVKEMEKLWSDYLFKTYQVESQTLTQSMNEYEEVPGIGDTLDSYTLSPDGSLLAYRAIDPLSGVVSIQLRRTEEESESISVIHDHQSSALTLYFMQTPVIALSNRQIAYIVGTTRGPELEIRKIYRDKDGEISLEPANRISLHQLGFAEANSPVISTDESQLAFVGFIPKGWANVYTLNLPPVNSNGRWKEQPSVRALTQGYYSWRSLSWSNHLILGSGDKTPNGKYGIFSIEPTPNGSTQVQSLLIETEDQLAPSGTIDQFVFQSWSSGSSQIHEFRNGEVYQLTNSKVGLMSPQKRQGRLYALGLKGGRFHLYKIPASRVLSKKTPDLSESMVMKGEEPWKANLLPIPASEIESYRPFRTSGSIRLDDLGAFFSTGFTSGVYATVSDLMRDYSLTGQFSYLGDYGLTNTFLVLSSNRGRSTWSLGFYNILQPRVDNIYSTYENFRTYVHKELGGVGAFKYPLGAYSFGDLALRVASVRRTDYSDPSLATAWQNQTPSPVFMLAPVVRLGYDEILYEVLTGPLRGYSALIESETSLFPNQSAEVGTVSERLRLDLAYYFQPSGRTVIAVQGLAGAAWGSLYRNSYLISSDDILRGYTVLDPRLFGNYVVAGRLEFRFPIGSLFQFPYLRGLAALDYGSVAQKPQDLSSRIGSSYTLGLSFNIPPLSMGFMLSNPIQVAEGPKSGAIFHFVLRYLYF
jgi:hypothetical protein